MRIAIITNEFPARSETFISNKILKLAQKGHDVFVICHTLNKMLFEELFQSHINIKVVEINRENIIRSFFIFPVKTSRLLLAKKKNRNNYFNALKAAIINNCDPQIIHFEFSVLAFDYLNFMEILPAKKVVSCRGTAEKVKLLVHEERKQKLAKVFEKVDAIHCVSEDMRQTILPFCSQPSKIFINFPSVDVPVFTRSIKYVAQPLLTIISVGRLTFQKGYFTGLIAVKQLKNMGIPFQWLIIGRGVKEEALIFYINQMQLKNEVKLLGAKSRSEIIELYQQADIFFLPSVYEGIANAALEAMSMELPVVSTRSGGMEEVIEHGVDGFLANTYDSRTLGIFLLQLAKDFALRKKTGEAARKKTMEHFEISRQVKKFETVYEGLIGILN